MKRMKEKFKLFMMVAMLFTLSTGICFADGGYIEKFQEMMKANDTMAWGILGPILIISATAIMVLGILVLVAAIGYIAWKGLTQFFGKGVVGAKELKITGIGLVIGLLVTGGGWVSVVKLLDRVVVSPGEQILQQEQTK
jgi:hypothetical protein